MNEVLNAIKNRRTIRRFKSTPIDEEKLLTILEAGRWAPSFSNLQPWRFIVIKDQSLKNAIDKAARESVLHLGINEAPVVILVCVDRRIDPLSRDRNRSGCCAKYDLGGLQLRIGGWLDWNLGNRGGSLYSKNL
jgi:nitroreductase